MPTDSFTFEFRPATIHQGPSAVATLGTDLEAAGHDRVLVVTSESVAASEAVMEPLRTGLDGRIVGIVDAVTPAKTLATAVDIETRADGLDASAIVGLGGGACIDVAKVASALSAHEPDVEGAAERMVAAEAIDIPDDGRTRPVYAVPTTLPGADLSQVAGVTYTLEPADVVASDHPRGGVSDARLMPEAVAYDHRLFDATPDDVLARSAMNGLDKGIELCYTRHRTPITDTTATHGLALLRESLPAIRDDGRDVDWSAVLSGIALVQYGVSTPRGHRANVIHAFGHALSRAYPLQQGVAHAIAAPHVLDALFESVHAGRDLLADGLVADLPEDATDAETADAVVEAVADLRDELGLLTRLRDVDGPSKGDVPTLAEAVLEDPFMAATPVEFDPDRAAIETVFEAMW